jgi:predicted CoA-binding protein
MSLREEIADFLGRKRIAVVGVSTDPSSFSRGLFREFMQRGYDVIPVNPKAKNIEGRQSYGSVCAIHPHPDAVLIMTPASRTDEVVRDCAESGVDSVWMYRAGGKGAVSPAAVEFCRENGIHVNVLRELRVSALLSRLAAREILPGFASLKGPFVSTLLRWLPTNAAGDLTWGTELL